MIKITRSNGKKTYGGSDDDRGSDIVQTSDGGFAILGLQQK